MHNSCNRVNEFLSSPHGRDVRLTPAIDDMPAMFAQFMASIYYWMRRARHSAHWSMVAEKLGQNMAHYKYRNDVGAWAGGASVS